MLSVSVMKEEPLENGEILLIIDTSEQYSSYAECFSAKESARLSKHKFWYHQIPLQNPNTKVPTGAIYKTTWEEVEALKIPARKNFKWQGSTHLLHYCGPYSIYILKRCIP